VALEEVAQQCFQQLGGGGHRPHVQAPDTRLVTLHGGRDYGGHAPSFAHI
jgi:hypothetical protein